MIQELCNFKLEEKNKEWLKKAEEKRLLGKLT